MLHGCGKQYTETRAEDFTPKQESQLPSSKVELSAIERQRAQILKDAESGDAESQWKLGGAYRTGFLGGSVDPVNAAIWYKKSADQGYDKAQLSLALLYSEGGELPKDITKAVELYKKAAAQGNPDAQYMLGFLYGTGEGLPQDDIEAGKWYKRAAVQGKAAAQISLSSWYGLSFPPRDNVLSYAWCNLAAAQDKKWAKVCDTIATRLTPHEFSEGQQIARNWIKGDDLHRQ